MRKTNYFILFLIIISGLIIMLPACGPDNGDEEETDSVGKFEAKSFSVENYNFAILENKEFITYNKAIYHRGDEVYLVLENVGPFLVGPDSLNHAEMKLKVVDAVGETVIERDSLFGTNGHQRFPNNIIKKPFGSFPSNVNNKPGKYTIYITVYDLVRNDSIPIQDDFYLE
jgi:hypothetical protein